VNTNTNRNANLKDLKKAIKEKDICGNYAIEEQIIKINQSVKYILNHLFETGIDDNGTVYFDTESDGTFICYTDYLVIWQDTRLNNLTIDNRVYTYMKDIFIPLAEKVRQYEKDNLLIWQQE